MFLHVLGEGDLAGECQVAALAEVRLVAYMAPHMRGKHNFLSEGLGAVGTCVGLLFCVGAHVPLELTRVHESLPTFLTLVRPRVDVENASERHENGGLGHDPCVFPGRSRRYNCSRWSSWFFRPL